MPRVPVGHTITDRLVSKYLATEGDEMSAPPLDRPTELDEHTLQELFDATIAHDRRIEPRVW